MSAMKELAISLLAVVVLGLVFSLVCTREGLPPEVIGIAPRYPGDSGVVLTGGGHLMADAETFLPREATRAEEKEGPGETEITAEGIRLGEKEEKTMDGGWAMYWCGVGTLLLGEAAALLLAAVWGKIRRKTE